MAYSLQFTFNNLNDFANTLGYSNSAANNLIQFVVSI